MFVRRLVPGAALALLLTLSACGGGGGGGGGNTPTDPNAISAVIGPEGGSISHPSGAVVQVPAGLLAAPSTVRVSAIDGNSIGNPESSSPASPAVEIRIESADLYADGEVRLNLPLTSASTADTYGIVVGADGVARPQDPEGPVGQGTLTVNIPAIDFQATREGSAATRSMAREAKNIFPDPPTARVDLYKIEASAGESAGLNSGWNREVSPDWTGKRIAIVVHGIMNQLPNMNSLARYLRDLRTPQNRPMYNEVYGCDTEWKASIAQNGDLLAQIIETHVQAGVRIDLYGHSQGGLICRQALEGRLKGTDAGMKVERLFTLGTPHTGVPPKGLRFASENFIIDYIAPGVQDLNENSTFLQSLNAGDAVSTQYILLAGDHYEGYQGKWGKRIYDYLQEPVDGIVPLRSARSETAKGQGTNSVILPTFDLNHSEIGGRFQDASNLNLDKRGGQKLRDHILQTGSTGVIIQ